MLLIKPYRRFNSRNPGTNEAESNIRSAIDVLRKEIGYANIKYEEAVATHETDAVKKAIQRNIDYFRKQVNTLENRIRQSSIVAQSQN